LERPVVHLKIDLHLHTVYSDGHGTVEEVLEEAEVKGLDGLAITDHGTLDGYFKAKSYNTDLFILPGFEASTDAGHVLVLGLEQLPPRVKKVRYETLVRWANRLGGLTVLAHVAAGKINLERWMACKPDAIEALNALYPFTRFFVSRGLRVASSLGVPCVGGSDAHYPSDIGDAYTVVEMGNPGGEDSLEAIKKAIKNGKVRFDGKLSPLSKRLQTGLGYGISFML
jgi:predicted metal-dependent phosphoesterase TrpH